MTDGHPDPDDLADLAAEVLDAESTTVLRQHVSGCEACAGLLDDAARVRSLLLADDPGPMPDDVWVRLEAALAREGALVTGVHPAGVTVLASDPPSDGPAKAKLRRPVRPVHTTRRQQRNDRAGRWASVTSGFGWGVAAVAAGIIVVMGLGVTVLQGLLPGDSNVAGAGLFARDGEDEDAPAAGAATAPRSVIVSTGTNYQPAKLESQVRDLVAAVHGTEIAYDDSTEASSESDVKALQSVPRSELPPGAWTSAELASCLKALDAEDLSPVAVDFAKFDGREVALLVLPSPAQEYEVWAVSRTCSPGDDGTQFFQIVKP